MVTMPAVRDENQDQDMHCAALGLLVVFIAVRDRIDEARFAASFFRYLIGGLRENYRAPVHHFGGRLRNPETPLTDLHFGVS